MLLTGSSSTDVDAQAQQIRDAVGHALEGPSEFGHVQLVENDIIQRRDPEIRIRPFEPGPFRQVKDRKDSGVGLAGAGVAEDRLRVGPELSRAGPMISKR